MRTQNFTITESLKTSVLSETKQAIQDAQNGQLSPYWQEYYLRNLASYKSTPYYPEHGDTLQQMLCSAISSQEQITDIEYAKYELASNNSELLFFYMKDHGSVIEISYSFKLHLFSCDIGIDDDLDDSQKIHRISDMKSALLCWTTASGSAFDPSFAHKTMPSLCTNSFLSLTDTLCFLFSELDSFLPTLNN